MSVLRALACASVLLLAAGPAAATTFNFLSGSAKITANVIGSPTLLVDETVALDGTFIDFDAGTITLPDFEFSVATTPPIAMNGSYGGYDTFVIESALLTPGVGYSSSGVFIGGTEYSVSLGPVDVDAVYSASDSTLTNPPVNNVPISFTNPTLNATIDTNLMTLEMMGVTLGIIPAFPGESAGLIVKGDITFVGTLVPEPGTGLLLGVGLIAIAKRRKR